MNLSYMALDSANEMRCESNKVLVLEGGIPLSGSPRGFGGDVRECGKGWGWRRRRRRRRGWGG